jgi:hypothetical protein
MCLQVVVWGSAFTGIAVLHWELKRDSIIMSIVCWGVFGECEW